MFNVWCVLAVLFLLFEINSPGLLFFLSFFFGASVAAGVSLWCYSPLVQCASFLITTVIAAFCLRLWVQRESNIQPGHKTNTVALHGKTALVTETIDAHKTGLVKINGEIWSAKSATNEVIPAGTLVQIVRIQGSHAIVQLINHHSSPHL